MSRAKARNKPECYTEKHHIVPRCMGGSNAGDNIAVLTAREHYISHKLLTYMTEGRAHHQMVYALLWMTTTNNKCHDRSYRPSSRTIATLREQTAKAASYFHKGKTVSEESRRKMSKAKTGMKYPNRPPVTDETKSKLSKSLKGKKPSPETVAKIVKARSWYVASEETRKKIGDAHRGKTVIHTPESNLKRSLKMKGVPRPNSIGRPVGSTHTEESIAKMKASHSNRPVLTCEHCGKTVQKPMYARWHGEKCTKR